MSRLENLGVTANAVLNTAVVGLIHAQNTIDSRVNRYVPGMLLLNALTMCSNLTQATYSFWDRIEEWHKNTEPLEQTVIAISFIGTCALLGGGAILLNQYYLPRTALKEGAVWTNTGSQNIMQLMTFANLGLNASLACFAKETSTKTLRGLFTAGHLYSANSIASQNSLKLT